MIETFLLDECLGFLWLETIIFHFNINKRVIFVILATNIKLDASAKEIFTKYHNLLAEASLFQLLILLGALATLQYCDWSKKLIIWGQSETYDF